MARTKTNLDVYIAIRRPIIAGEQLFSVQRLTMQNLMTAAETVTAFPNARLSLETDSEVVHQFCAEEIAELTTPGQKLAIAREVVWNIQGPDTASPAFYR